ncbi:MAG TPA: 4Fe-4S binding protein [Dongiaceae bacterium]|nr:4Fe-4S binding protein [Dongiaceae bacterium]
MKAATINRPLLLFSILAAITTFSLADVLWRAHARGFATSIFLLGLSLGPGLTYYAGVATGRKQAARRIVLLTGGLSIMAFGLLGRVNLDLEGFFMLLFLGTAGAAIGHTLVTVIVGPLFFGRFLCGWGCWRGMLLEQLPVAHGAGRRGGVWNVIPYFGLAVSVGAAALSVFVLRQYPGGTPGAMHSGSVRAIMVGFAVYYLASIGMAFAMRDQRAFCKYLCPSGVILGFTSRTSILKMTADRSLCNACSACSKICPMDIDVAHFAERGERVLSGQCILCQRCAHACPTDALRLTAGFDRAGERAFMLRRHIS